MSRTTHTYVTLELSPAAFGEIKEKLQAAGYDHLLLEENPGLISMNGIAVAPEKATKKGRHSQ